MAGRSDVAERQSGTRGADEVDARGAERPIECDGGVAPDEGDEIEGFARQQRGGLPGERPSGLTRVGVRRIGGREHAEAGAPRFDELEPRRGMQAPRDDQPPPAGQRREPGTETEARGEGLCQAGGAGEERYLLERERGADDRVEIVVRLGVRHRDHPREPRQACGEGHGARAHLGERDPRERPVAPGADHVHDLRGHSPVDPQQPIEHDAALGRERGAGDGAQPRVRVDRGRSDLGAHVAAERRVDLLEPRRRRRPPLGGAPHARGRGGAIDVARLRVHDGDLRGDRRGGPDRDGDGSLAREQRPRVAGGGEIVGHDREGHGAAYYSKG